MARFLLGMLCGAAVLYTFMHYHVVRGKDGIFLVAKIDAGFTDSYVDTRSLTLNDWQSHKPLATAIMKCNQTELLPGNSVQAMGESAKSLFAGLFHSR